MPRPILALIADLADAIALADAEATFRATADLGEIIGLEAAVAVAQALAFDAGAVATAPARLVVTLAPEVARCA